MVSARRNLAGDIDVVRDDDDGDDGDDGDDDGDVDDSGVIVAALNGRISPFTFRPETVIEKVRANALPCREQTAALCTRSPDTSRIAYSN